MMDYFNHKYNKVATMHVACLIRRKRAPRDIAIHVEIIDLTLAKEQHMTIYNHQKPVELRKILLYMTKFRLL